MPFADDESPSGEAGAALPARPAAPAFSAEVPEPALQRTWFGGARVDWYVAGLAAAKQVVEAAGEYATAKAAYVQSAALLEKAEADRWYGVRQHERMLREKALEAVTTLERARELTSLEHKAEVWRKREALAKAQERAQQAERRVEAQTARSAPGADHDVPPEVEEACARQVKLQEVREWVERRRAAILSTVDGDESKLSERQREELEDIEAAAYAAEDQIRTQTAAQGAYRFAEEDDR